MLSHDLPKKRKKNILHITIVIFYRNPENSIAFIVNKPQLLV